MLYVRVELDDLCGVTYDYFVFDYSYDYILRTETMDTDANYILPLLNQTRDVLQRVITNKSNRTIKNSSGAQVKRSRYYLKDLQQLPTKMISGLMKKYLTERVLFGYHFDVKHMEASCAIESDNGYCC